MRHRGAVLASYNNPGGRLAVHRTGDRPAKRQDGGRITGRSAFYGDDAHGITAVRRSGTLLPPPHPTNEMFTGSSAVGFGTLHPSASAPLNGSD